MKNIGQEIGFSAFIRLCLTERYWNYDNRATRLEYWHFQAFRYAIFLVFLTCCVIAKYIQILGGNGPELPVGLRYFLIFCGTILYLYLLPPSLGISNARYRDFDRDGGVINIGLIALIPRLEEREKENHYKWIIDVGINIVLYATLVELFRMSVLGALIGHFVYTAIVMNFPSSTDPIDFGVIAKGVSPQIQIRDEIVPVAPVIGALWVGILLAILLLAGIP